MSTEAIEQVELEDLVLITADQVADLALHFNEKTKCSAKAYSCFDCSYSIQDCDKEATWVVIRSCGCVKPLCDEHKVGYSVHFKTCTARRLRGRRPYSYRCAWCHKEVDPYGFRYEAI